MSPETEGCLRGHWRTATGLKAAMLAVGDLAPSDLELLVDAILSAGNNFDRMMAGWELNGEVIPNRTSHREGSQPARGNLLFVAGPGFGGNLRR
jgi:hypothetical protein